MRTTLSFDDESTSDVMTVGRDTDNGPFVSLELREMLASSTVAIFLHRVEDADALIAAAVAARVHLEAIVEERVQVAWSAVADYCLDARCSQDATGKMLDRVEALVREDNLTAVEAIAEVVGSPSNGDTSAEEHAACLADARYHADREAV